MMDNQTKPNPLPPADSLHGVCLDLWEKVETFLAEKTDAPLLQNVQAQLRISIGVVEAALERYQFEQLSISYNGGKDCLVLLVIILSCLARRFSPFETPQNSNTSNGSKNPSGFPEKLKAIYIVSPQSFPQIDAFVASSGAEYHLEVERFMLPMKEGLETYLADHPTIKAIFVGTRRTDPHGEKLVHFDPTDAGWPDFMRIHPVIDWHYAEIWAFIRHLKIEYCSLYDQGYTSLGGKQDTFPNPHLKKIDENGEEFRPAYELTEDNEERLGRKK